MPDLTHLLQVLVSGVGVGCIYGLIGIGFCVIYNASGIVNFAQGAFVMLGGVITQVLLTRAGMPLVLAAIVAIALVAAMGVVIERLVDVRDDESRRTPRARLWELLSWKHGTFDLDICPVARPDRVNMGMTELLIEHARDIDEEVAARG